MKALNLMPLGALFLVVSANAATVDCSKGKSRGEYLSCTDPDLRILDVTLNHRYAAALAAVSDKRALISTQREWLKKVRDRCDERNCLVDAYDVRSAELSAKFADGVAINDAPLSDQEARQACTELAELADNRQLANLELVGLGKSQAAESPPALGLTITDKEIAQLDLANRVDEYAEIDKVFRLHLKNNQTAVRFAGAWSRGSCQAYHLFSVPLLLTRGATESGIENVHDPKEKIRWAHWGGGDYPVIFRNRNFIITTDLNDKNHINMISWVKPSGRIRPLCLMKTAKSGKAIISSKNDALCTGIVSGALQPTESQDVSADLRLVTKDDRKEYEKRYGRYADIVKIVDGDIDSDGVPEKIGQFLYSSGAGCGSESTWLGVLSEDLGHVVTGPLHDQLGKLSSVTGLYKFGGVQYIEGERYIDGEGDSDRSGIFRIHDGRLDQVCKLRPVTKTTIETFFRVKN